MSETPNLGEALRHADWDDLLPRLVAYAEWRLRRVGWSAGQDREPSAMSVQQVINTAVQTCLEDRRRWPESCPDLEIFLKGVVKNIVWNAKRAALRDKADPTPDPGTDMSADLPAADEVLAEEQGRAAIFAACEECVSDDPKLQDLYLAILDGNTKRDDIARALGWSPDDVTAARVKLRRRLVSKFPNRFMTAQKRSAS